MKYDTGIKGADVLKSHPARGAWIEIGLQLNHNLAPASRTPHGVRGLKLSFAQSTQPSTRRTPHGVRGLK